MFPKAPPFGRLRLASIADVPRIAVVATAGFRYSPVFDWERQYHDIYPRDTLQSYEKMFADIIRSPEYAVLVVEDLYQPLESNATKAIISPDDRYEVPASGSSAIVGAASWKFEPGSARVGQFMDLGDIDDPRKPVFDGGLRRDKNENHIRLLDDGCDAAEEEYFRGYQLMDMVVVHPAYWRRGHGATLVRWGMSLADADRVKQGVIAADMGEKLYLSLGYRKLSEVYAEDEENPDLRVKVGVLEYIPKERSEL